MHLFWSLFFLPLLPLWLLLLLVIFLFEVWMFVDVIQNPAIESQEKLLWLIGMLLFHPFIAIAYYFIARRPRPRS